MAWNPFKKDSWSKVGNEIKKPFEKAGDKVDDRFQDIFDDIKSKIESAAREVEGGIKQAGREIEEGANHAKNEIESTANKAKNEIESEINKIPQKIEDEFEDFISALARAVTKEGLKKIKAIVDQADKKIVGLGISHPGLTDEINNLGFTMEIGPVTLSYSDFYGRASNISGVLDTYINSPPALRRGPIIKMIQALGPTWVNLGASIQVVALVVGSKELGVGGSLNRIGSGLFEELADAILKELGVPA